MSILVVIFLMLQFFNNSSLDTVDTLPASQQTTFVPKQDFEKSLIKSLHICNCYNITEEQEIECRCMGQDLLHVPTNISIDFDKLTITDANIQVIEKYSLQNYKRTLKDVTLENLPHLKVIEAGTFSDIEHLRTLYIFSASKLKVLPGLFQGVTSTKFSSLRIVRTGLFEMPDLSQLPSENIVHLVDFDHNQIEKLTANSVKINAEQVTLNYNELTVVENLAFNGSQIAKLNLNTNLRLTKLEPRAFEGLQSLRELDLSMTSIENLPVIGLNELETLVIENTPSMKVIPSIYDLENLKVARLTHPFHCCAFKYPEQHNPMRHAQQAEKLKRACQEGTFPIDTGQTIPPYIRRKRDDGDYFYNMKHDGHPLPPHQEFLPHIDFQKQIFNKTDHSFLMPNRGKAISFEQAKSVEIPPDDIGTFFQGSAETTKHSNVTAFCGNFSVRKPSVTCYPESNALNPCEDIMGFSWLRISVWFVVVLAVVGNLAVIIVVLFSGGELTVSRFLMCNLAFADFCMGLYLLLIASMDLHSVGSYFNFAFDWQYGLGCKMAGFLTVFASHLSIFTLTVVTFERWFAITYAIHLTKRIRIGAASKIMLGGWIYSVILAILPLVGVSNYSSTSICLPMEINRIADRAYLFSIIIVNVLAFALIVFCYAQIYLSLGYETRRSNTKGEMTIAKKMALLIFTDFATWAPISFFSITALAGYPLIGVTKSKILLVFFYPINSCANPYLYAMMTAQYRRDFFQLLSRCGLCKKAARRYTLPTYPTSNNSNPVPLLAKSNGKCQSLKVNNADDTFV